MCVFMCGICVWGNICLCMHDVVYVCGACMCICVCRFIWGTICPCANVCSVCVWCIYVHAGLYERPYVHVCIVWCMCVMHVCACRFVWGTTCLCVNVCSVRVWCMYGQAGLYEELHVHVCMCVVYVCGAHMCMQVCVHCGEARGWCQASSSFELHLTFWDRASHWTRLADWSGAGGIFLHPLPSTDYRLMSSTASCLIFLWVLAIWTQVLALVQCTLQPPSHFRALMLSLLVDFLEHLFCTLMRQSPCTWLHLAHL